MRVRLTVTPRIESPGPGSVDREAGANPARSRHCDRGSPPHAPAIAAAGHWHRLARAGKARKGRPGSQETSLRPQAFSPRGKGWLPMQIPHSAGLVAGVLALTLL